MHGSSQPSHSHWIASRPSRYRHLLLPPVNLQSADLCKARAAIDIWPSSATSVKRRLKSSLEHGTHLRGAIGDLREAQDDMEGNVVGGRQLLQLGV